MNVYFYQVSEYVSSTKHSVCFIILSVFLLKIENIILAFYNLPGLFIFQCYIICEFTSTYTTYEKKSHIWILVFDVVGCYSSLLVRRKYGHCVHSNCHVRTNWLRPWCQIYPAFNIWSFQKRWLCSWSEERIKWSIFFIFFKNCIFIISCL